MAAALWAAVRGLEPWLTAGSAEGALELPLEIREQVVRLELEGETGAAGSVLLDERFRRRPVPRLATVLRAVP